MVEGLYIYVLNWFHRALVTKFSKGHVRVYWVFHVGTYRISRRHHSRAYVNLRRILLKDCASSHQQ